MDERRTCWQTVDDNKIREENQHGQKVCVLWKKNTRCCLFKQETDLLTAKCLWRFPVWRMVLLFTNRFLLWNLLYEDMQPLWDGDCRLKYDCWTVTECKYKKLGLVGFFLGFFPYKVLWIVCFRCYRQWGYRMGKPLYLCCEGFLKLGPVCRASLSASLHTLSSSPLLWCPICLICHACHIYLKHTLFKLKVKRSQGIYNECLCVCGLLQTLTSKHILSCALTAMLLQSYNLLIHSLFIYLFSLCTARIYRNKAGTRIKGKTVPGGGLHST